MNLHTHYAPEQHSNGHSFARLLRRAFLLCAAGLGLALSLNAAEVTTDQSDYPPGATATITGSGFAADESVMLQVLHSDGTPGDGEDHEPWVVQADASGALLTWWHVCEDDCVDSTLLLTALGQTSGLQAQATFTDASFFGVRFVSALNLSGGCSRTLTTTTNVQAFVRPGQIYRFTFTLNTNGAPPACFTTSNNAGPASIQMSLNANFGSITFLARRSGTNSAVYTNTIAIPAGACSDTPITFTCDSGSMQQVLGNTGTPDRPAELIASLNCTNVLSCGSSSNLPSIFCAGNLTVNTSTGLCSAVVNYALPPATGTPTPTVRCTPPPGSTLPKGVTLVTCTASNGVGTASCSFVVTVRDVEPPRITSCAPAATALAGEGCQAAVPDLRGLVSASDNCTGATNLIISQSPAPGTMVGLGATPVTITVRDGTTNNSSQCLTTFTVVNSAPVISSITGPSAPLTLGTAATLTVNFTDADTQTHTVALDWDDGSSDSIPLASGVATATQTHTYAAAGVYSVTVTVSDPCTSVSAVYEFIVVYDPNGGFVTGGGWIDSPAGAFTADPSLTGKANFGFVSRYQQGASVPTGQTEFQFKAGELNFHSTDYQWLVISGAKAQYKGTGTINGTGSYNFLLTATDGEAAGGGGVDKFRIKISGAGGVVYDNVIGSSDDMDTANPQVLGGGSIVIHR